MVLVLVFVVPLELLAGVLAFLARDGGAATGEPGVRSPVMALFLLTVVPLVLAAAAFQGKPLFAVLLLAGACRFVLLGVYQAGAPAPLQTVAGWLGLALAAFALYSGLALLLEDAAQRTVLPLGRRGRARLSLEGDLRHQLDRAEREAGVRRQL